MLGGRAGPLEEPLLISCVFFDKLLLVGEDSLLSCVFLLSHVKSFLFGGSRTFLAFEVGDGVADGGGGGGGAGLKAFWPSGLGVLCPSSPGRPSLGVVVVCSFNVHV